MLKYLSRSANQFIPSQSLGGVLLAVAALAALLLSNSPWGDAYQRFLHIPGELRLGGLQGGTALVLSKPLVVWVNDLWMAVFFFLVGLEIKREMLEGELATRSQVLLPAVAALGGMAVPALIFAAINWGNPVALRGWGIPMATDIAFALGILVLLGSRVPASLKVFLTAVAIIDDLGAILVIAFFYTADLSLVMLLAAGVGGLLLALLNRAGVKGVGPYVMVGLVIWLCVLKSGVHATLAGVVTALAIPMSDGKGGSPLNRAEHAIQPWVAFLVLPVFAFSNAGVSLQGVTLASFTQTIPLGIAAGLAAGQGHGRVWRVVDLDPSGGCTPSSTSQLAPVLWCMRFVWCGFHHEPVYRLPRFRRHRGCLRSSGQARRADGFSAVSRVGSPVAGGQTECAAS